MDGPCRITAWIVFVGWATLAASAAAREPTLQERTWRDDAALYDVEFVSSREGWAVGEHGAVWQTRDGGATWSPSETGVAATWKSVCLLTDQVGWVAGAAYRGSAELNQPVLLATRDGGASWEPVPTETLTPLKCVRFVDFEEGIAIGEPTGDNPAGVWQTSDGGKHWQPIPGPGVRGWNAAGLVSSELGLLADRDGNIALLAGPRLLPSRLPPLSGRAVHGVTVTPDHRAWLVGDGGLVMTSPSGGVVWEQPAQSLPEEVRHLTDFQTVAAIKNSVWIAGKPGGIIWHSPNGGRTWQRQTTNVTTPLHKIHFVTERQGSAVGELGVILVTHDGGETWQQARGQGRHAALLAIHNRLSSYAPEMTAHLSGEQGYRSVAWVVTRPAETAGASSTERLQAAINRTGGSAAGFAWELPVDIPGLELDAEKLEQYWQSRTEGRLSQTMIGGLVREIRLWRPHVVVVDQPAPEDALGRLVYDATLLAIEQAGDSTRYLHQRELAGLPAWTVDRVYLQLLPGSSGSISLDPFQLLPRWGTNARLAAAPSRDLLGAVSMIARPNFRLISAHEERELPSRASDLFAGLNLAPGSDVRRELPAFNDAQLDGQIKAAQRYRNVIAHAERTFDDPRLASQMLAQLGEITSGMTNEQAAQTLHDLLSEYRQRGQYELAEAAAEELIRRFPQAPHTAGAARWLLTCLASEEVAWQRVRGMNRQREVNRKLAAAAEAAQIQQVSHTAQITQLPEWKERLPRSQRVAQQLEQIWPQSERLPETQFTLAALSRARGSTNQADVILRRGLTNFEGQDRGEWTNVFRREVWLANIAPEIPEGISNCERAESKPLLDGLLSDDCWQAAREWTLTHRVPTSMPDSPAPLAMLTYDDEFLYIAASVSRMEGSPDELPKLAGRTYDADLRRYDRISIRIDCDRDYATWYEFQVDQRGCTAETCWDDAQWNPKYFVAVDSDESQWRVEIAIPWAELSPRAPKPGMAWGLGLERIAPTVGRQCWTRPTPDQHPGTSLGVLRFE